MEIKSSRDYHYMYIFILLVLAAFPVVLDFHAIGIYTSLIVGFVAVRFWISIGRTFIFDEKGCSVSFLFYSRFYRWEELHVQHLSNAEVRHGYRIPYDETLFFAPKKYNIPKRMKIGVYSGFLHPFSLIYIYPIDPNNNINKPGYGIPAMYEVDQALVPEILKWAGTAKS